MGTRYTTTPAVSFNSAPPPDDGTQVAGNLVQWSMVKTKLADPVHVQADAIDSKLVSALDLSARAISTPDTAVASDHWKTLQVTGTTTITLSSAASMGAGYEVGVFNAGVGVVTVTPGAAADTINGLSASVTVSIKGTKIFRTNQALTGYNVVGGYDPQTVTASTSVVTPLVASSGAVNFTIGANGGTDWVVVNADKGLYPNTDNTQQMGGIVNRISKVFAPIIDTGTTGSGALKTNNGTTVLTWANDLSTTLAGVLRGPATMMAPITNSLGADVNLNNTANYFDGPSIAQGTAGTWFVSATVTVVDTGAGTHTFFAKLWDGTTVIASTDIDLASALVSPISLSGFLTAPAGNLRVSVKDTVANTGKILFNASGNSKDSTITAIRIA